MRTPLVLGPLAAEGFGVRRSGMRWLRPDGHVCRPGELIAQTEIRIVHRGGSAPFPFPGEATLQVALASPVGGRLHIDETASAGGWMDRLAVHDWTQGDVVASIEAESQAGPVSDVLPLRRLMLAGRRMAWVVDVQNGLLPGWHLTARGWWGEDAPPATTLLSIGICDATCFVRGEEGCFSELFELADFPAHIVHATENPIAPCAPILLDQLRRTPAEMEEIAYGLRRALGKGPVAPTGDDYMFAGALLKQMASSPLRDGYDVLGPKGLTRLPPADVVLLSAAGEPVHLLRHRRFGYAMQVFNYNMAGAGPAMRAWLQSAFEPVTRTVEDMRRDLEQLIDETHAATGARFIILNRMSTSGWETVGSYGAFRGPLEDEVKSVRSKSINLMLHGLAERRPVSILDVDALAAEIGGGRHLPDGLHSTGALQDALRRELLEQLRPARQSTRKSISMSAAPAA